MQGVLLGFRADSTWDTRDTPRQTFCLFSPDFQRAKIRPKSEYSKRADPSTVVHNAGPYSGVAHLVAAGRIASTLVEQRRKRGEAEERAPALSCICYL